jgi:hypothetical protein
MSSQRQSFVSRLRDLARKAQEDPEGFREDVVKGARRLGEGVDKLKNLHASIDGSPEKQRELQNYFISLLGQGVREAIDAKPPQQNGRRKPRTRARARPRKPGPVDSFMRSAHYGGRR